VKASASPEPSAGDPALHAQYTLARVQQIKTQVRRLAIPYALHELFVVWLLWRVDLRAVGLAWLALAATLHVIRSHTVRVHRESATRDPERELRELSGMFVALGLCRGLLTVALFSIPVTDSHYVFTMLVLGLAAGGVGSVGGVMRTYLAWGVAVGGPLAAGWALQGNASGYGLALVTVGLIATLAAAVRDQGIALERLVATAHEKEVLAESLRLERDRANLANQSKTRFFAAASHDLRQPLHALSINATALELIATSQSNALIKDLSESILRALRQSNSLLDGLLDISRLDANAVEVRTGPIEITELLGTIKDEFAPIATQRKLALRVDIESRQALWIESDRDLLVRVLNNLVSNSLKFTNAGEVVLFARRDRCAEQTGAVRFGVRDTGVGIPIAEQERVFEEFYQLGNASRDRSLGLGLGLSIVKRTADLLGIAVSMDSTLGQGTTFCLSTGAIAEPPSPARLREAEVAFPRLDARILVIDDEPEILDSLAALLPQLGCEVRVAENLEQAQGVVDAGFDPDALVVDHRLRGASGVEVLSQLRAAGPARPLVRPALIITGDTAPHNIQQAQASGLRVLHKPLDGRKLAWSLADLLNHSASLGRREEMTPAPAKA
jgi:signal transduction histidine kinase